MAFFWLFLKPSSTDDWTQNTLPKQFVCKRGKIKVGINAQLTYEFSVVVLWIAVRWNNANKFSFYVFFIFVLMFVKFQVSAWLAYDGLSVKIESIQQWG